MQKKSMPISGLGLVVVTRAEQVFKHQHTIANDAAYYSRNVFERAAVAIIHSARKEWPEHDMPLAVYNKIISKDRVEQYAHAAAFLCAAIDYVKRGEFVQAIQRSEIMVDEDDRWMNAASTEMMQLDLLINATPTGDVRNTLCDIQIHLQYLLKLLGNDNHTTKLVDNVVKSESVQDLYAMYMDEKSDPAKIISDSFEGWLRESKYL